MRFAVLGDDPQAIILARGVHASGHSLTWVGEADDTQSALLKIAPRATVGEPWEALFSDTVDAVIVASGADLDRRAEQLRKLLLLATPVLVVHPIGLSALLYYELEMIRRDTHGVIQFYAPGRFHPLLVELARVIRDGGQVDSAVASKSFQTGRVEQIVCERSLVNRTKDTVWREFVRDAALITQLCGKLDKVHALAGNPAQEYHRLNVQMSGPNAIAVRWSVGPIAPVNPKSNAGSVDPREGAVLSIIGDEGQLCLHMPSEGAWMLDTTPDEPGDEQPSESSERAAHRAIDRFVEAIASQTTTSDSEAAADWKQATHTLELAEAAQRSLIKGRTVGLQIEEQSEQAAFKGVMSALGCGILMFGMVLMVVAGIMEFFAGALGVPPQWAQLSRLWIVVVLVLMGVFLLLQLLPALVFRGDQEKEK